MNTDLDYLWADEVYESEVQFLDSAQVPQPGPTPSMHFVPWVKAAVASTILAACVAVPCADAVASETLVHPSALVETENSTVSPRAPWWSTVEDRLARLRALPAGWEPGAPAISETATYSALAALEQVVDAGTPQPDVVPTIDGGVQLEWHQNGVDLEVRVTPVGKLFMFFSKNAVDTEREVDLTKAAALGKWLSKLTA